MRGNKSVGELLLTCRQKANMTQKELASKLMVHDSVVSRVEAGKISPGYTLVKEWARATECEDMISMDLAGRDSWKKFRQMEETVEKLRELVNFLRIRKEKRHAVKARG